MTHTLKECTSVSNANVLLKKHIQSHFTLNPSGMSAKIGRHIKLKKKLKLKMIEISEIILNTENIGYTFKWTIVYYHKPFY